MQKTTLSWPEQYKKNFDKMANLLRIKKSTLIFNENIYYLKI